MGGGGLFQEGRSQGVGECFRVQGQGLRYVAFHRAVSLLQCLQEQAHHRFRRPGEVRPPRGAAVVPRRPLLQQGLRGQFREAEVLGDRCFVHAEQGQDQGRQFARAVLARGAVEDQGFVRLRRLRYQFQCLADFLGAVLGDLQEAFRQVGARVDVRGQRCLVVRAVLDAEVAVGQGGVVRDPASGLDLPRVAQVDHRADAQCEEAGPVLGALGELAEGVRAVEAAGADTAAVRRPVAAQVAEVVQGVEAYVSVHALVLRRLLLRRVRERVDHDERHDVDAEPPPHLAFVVVLPWGPGFLSAITDPCGPWCSTPVRAGGRPAGRC